MNTDWQSWATPALVFLTLGLFGLRVFLHWKNPGRRTGCGHDCGCGAAKSPTGKCEENPTQQG
ncbi:MAG: hypothetical protein KDM91_04760 [Verrucomicrobiae bacterium]|nr:hypothetical protein [Verrucomicrobiae bacterium]MCP5539399.1 hypothetical protein [Akkermansiaceae bacterium]MCP5551075.1 hypothetical protein [Akkermansiaceae bacterium]